MKHIIISKETRYHVIINTDESVTEKIQSKLEESEDFLSLCSHDSVEDFTLEVVEEWDVSPEEYLLFDNETPILDKDFKVVL